MEKTASDYEWYHPQSAGDIFIKVGLFIVAAYLINKQFNTFLNEIDFGELQEIVRECTELDMKDIKYIDSSDSEKQKINIAGKITKNLDFKWKIDDNGNYMVPERLRKYIGISDLKIVKVNPYHNIDSNDILIISEEGDDTHFSEAYLRIRT